MVVRFYNGQRLSFDRQLCTVRYHGPVAGTKGEWLGVEWDDPTRGKHSGKHQDTRYFSCLNPHATAASFVRPTRKPDSPHSFVSALKAKYASDPFSDPNFEDPDVHIAFVITEDDNKKRGPLTKPIKFSGKVAEEVGFDKIRKQLAQLEDLRIVILDGLCMWRPEGRSEEGRDEWLEKRDVREACPEVVELDLSRNLFEEWREVTSICEQLDRLGSLRVDGNRFRDMSLTEAERRRCLKAFGNVKKLGMEENLLPWEQIAKLTHLFPTLSTFVASSNLYTTLTPQILNPTIIDLTLEDNLFFSLSALEPLTKLPNLQRLVLKQNKISEINSPGLPAPVFPSCLSEVDLSFNDITTWSFINDLEHVFPGLTSLRISHNPLYESLQAADGRALTADDGYMLTLARLGNLKTLNYSPINPKERLNSESYYLSLIAREVQFAPEHLQDQILKRHPRYKWLCEEYGEPNIQRSKNAVNPNSLAARLIRIKFCLVDHRDWEAEEAKSRIYEAEIPMSCTAYTVLGMAGKHFGIKPAKCKLTWETGDWMSANKTIVDLGEDDWDSDNSEDERGASRVMREVEIVPGTRTIGTWIDGSEAVVRVEIAR